CDRGSTTRCIGRERSDASPVKKAVSRVLATAPSSSRAAVPELPISSTSSGSPKPPTPQPRTDQLPAPCRRTSAPSARRAAAVRAHVGAERPQSGSRAVHVLALEKALDLRLADGEAAHDNRPVRDRLVAGHVDGAGEAPRAHRSGSHRRVPRRARSRLTLFARLHHRIAHRNTLSPNPEGGAAPSVPQAAIRRDRKS